MIRHKIKLVYWAEVPNFGDYLSPYIINKLSGSAIYHKIASLSWKVLLKYIIKYPFKLNSLKDYVLPWEDNFLCVGSILSYGNSKSRIWGSGFMNCDESFNGGYVYAVRGKESAQKIEQLTNVKCRIWGDPALLLPLLYTPNRRDIIPIGLIPHWKETYFFNKKYGDRYHIIDMRSSKIEDIIDDICSCKMILSTSLHGIIVAHAYGIPAIWIKESDINTDGFKFKDYFSSVKIDYYEGFKNYDDILTSSSSVFDFFSSHSDKSLPQINIKQIQKSLLLSAPFNLLDKWKKKGSQL